MILPINAALDDHGFRLGYSCCIFCGDDVNLREGGERVTLKDGRKIIATRYFHHECYLKNASESKKMRTQRAESER